MPKYERIWLFVGVLSLAVFLLILGIMAFSLGFRTPGNMKTIAPEAVYATAPFDNPGLYKTGDDSYRLVMVAKTFAFDPGEITIPAGSTVHFEVATPDVLHGVLIPGTTVNMMVIPGHITQFTYTFKESGDYPILCHEYCGVGHHLMMGNIVVQ